MTVTDSAVRRRRRLILPLATIGSVLLVPWTVYLAFALPHHYVARRWAWTWTGFDIVLTLALAATALLAWKRRLMTVVAAAVAGTMLLVDAWFDAMTATSGDQDESLLTALLLEVPMGPLLLATAAQITLRVARALATAQGAQHARWWQVPMQRPYDATAPARPDPTP
ncbi:hypothetical protein [Luteipulveratus halotolerans]|uniref:Uncharacterized protein n=1 Tax=Luteipulveratus halotolerans TaxID=1631356 RepID=A0A0L6CK87_9MICO|nr:hypothetical protein [Luteipulveratus halotolerans]KNX38187.1 hypothetical protein VV01_15205 [Luteipulveratus halotolerans]